MFANFADDPVVDFADDFDGDNDGFAIISENSLISGLPSTLIPYANFFIGFGNPQPLVDGNNAGILKNVGINFETDALTGYPKLDDTASNAFGGAIGLQYLFNLDRQIVFEVAMVEPFEDDGIGAQDTQFGFGVRYQVPINRAWLFRADATYQILEGADEDNSKTSSSKATSKKPRHPRRAPQEVLTFADDGSGLGRRKQVFVSIALLVKHIRCQ